MNRIISFILCISMVSCISIPKQAPLLSEELGMQISRLENSHLNLLHVYFDEKRADIDEFMQTTWVPEFTRTFFNHPEVQESWDEIITSNNTDDRGNFLIEVGAELQIVINEKRNELTDPLNKIENELEAAIRREYDNAKSMNNSLTTFLTTASKIKESQQRYLNMLNITDEKISGVIDKTDKVIADLVTNAEKVDDAQNKIEKYSEQADEYKKKLGELLSTIKK